MCSGPVTKPQRQAALLVVGVSAGDRLDKTNHIAQVKGLPLRRLVSTKSQPRRFTMSEQRRTLTSEFL